MYAPVNDYDYESQSYGARGKRRSLDPNFQFAEATVRQGFTRKVFGLLAVQLAVTMAVTAAFVLSNPVKLFVASNTWLLWTSMALSLGIVLVLSFWERGRRSHPLNLIMLGTFTVAEAVLVGAASATYDTQLVLLAGSITAGVVAALAVFSMQTKVDLTASGGALLSLLFVLLFASVLQSFIHVSWMELAICAGGALLFSVYLVFDIQLIMGTGSVAISPDEYVFAALNLYLDILNIFLYILRLLNEISNNSQ